MRRSIMLCLPLALVACDKSTTAPDEPDPQVCSDFELDVERYWSRESKARVRAGILAADASYGKIVVERVVTRMDAVTRDWVMMQEKVCKDTVVRKLMPAEVYNKISTCLLGNLAQQRLLVVVASSPRPDQLDLLESTIDAAGADMRLCLDKAVYSYYEDDELEAREAIAEAKVHRSVGDDEQANAAAERAQAVAEHGGSVGLRVDALVEKGWVLIEEVDYEGARSLADRALADAQAAGYEAGIASAAKLRGRVARETGDYDQALAHYTEALAIRERLLGTDHVDTASCYSDIGAAYYSKGQYDKALDFHRKSLAIKERLLGTDHPDIATAYNNIGSAYYSKREYAEALDYFLKGLAIRERVLGAEHPSTAISYVNTGSAYKSQREYDKALEYHRKALAIFERTLGTDHPDTAAAYSNIGSVHLSKREYGEALDDYRKALAIRERVLGADHPDTGKAYNNIGFAHFLAGEYDKALENYRKALAIKERVLGTEHPSTKSTRGNIADLCKRYAPACPSAGD